MKDYLHLVRKIFGFFFTLGDSPKMEKSENFHLFILKENWPMLILRPSRGHLSVK